MLEMIPKDFDVERIAATTNASVFAARRRDVWHFILATTERLQPNMLQVGIRQFHWPRALVAATLDPEIARPIPVQTPDLRLRATGDGVEVSLGDQWYRLPETLLRKMREDIRTLRRAQSQVTNTPGGFIVHDEATPAGHQVVVSSRLLADAIAFERESRKALDPSDFGAFSAYCTWRDFIYDSPERKRSIANGMAQEMVSWDTSAFGDDIYWSEVSELQAVLWGEVLWGRGLEPESETLEAAFSATFERLSSIQFAQFVLMNGMHPGGPFHPLALLFGVQDSESYLQSRTRGHQPDSLEEQKIRTDTAFIQLLAIESAGDSGVH